MTATAVTAEPMIVPLTAARLEVLLMLARDEAVRPLERELARRDRFFRSPQFGDLIGAAEDIRDLWEAGGTLDVPCLVSLFVTLSRARRLLEMLASDPEQAAMPEVIVLTIDDLIAGDTNGDRGDRHRTRYGENVAALSHGRLPVAAVLMLAVRLEADAMVHRAALRAYSLLAGLIEAGGALLPQDWSELAASHEELEQSISMRSDCDDYRTAIPCETPRPSEV